MDWLSVPLFHLALCLQVLYAKSAPKLEGDGQFHCTAGPWIMALHSTSFPCNGDEKKQSIPSRGHCECWLCVSFLWELVSSHIPKMCAGGKPMCLNCPRLSECGCEWPCSGRASRPESVPTVCPELSEGAPATHTLNWS